MRDRTTGAGAVEGQASESAAKAAHGRGGLLSRAAKAKAELPPPEPPRASELQETFARDLERKGVTVDPLTVTVYEARYPYYPVTVEVEGIRFSGSYLWGGRDWRYHYAGCLTATLHRGRFRRPRSVAFHTLADLAELKPGAAA